VRYEWSAAEAARRWSQGAAQLARTLLAAQARDLGKSIAGNASLLLAASPYAESAELIDACCNGHFAVRVLGCRGASHPGGVRAGGRSRTRAPAFLSG
jgi:hypothetical protein